VEAIGRNSNLGHLSKKWSDLLKRIAESPTRPRLPVQDLPRPRSKRFLNAQEVIHIAARYEAGETTQLVGDRYGISKSRVATILREHGITIRRQGLNDEHVREAATLDVAADHLRCSVLVTASPTRPSLLRFGAKACNFGRAQDGVKPRCLLGHTNGVDGVNTQAVFGTVTGPSGSVSFALSDAKNGVVIDELDAAERTSSGLTAASL
jgi:hypothetical protein